MEKEIELLNKTKDFIAEENKLFTNTGISFNLMKISQAPVNELSISKYLNEILDPNGKHGMGSKPLEFFLENLPIVFKNIPKGPFSVKREQYIGIKKTKDGNNFGGNIDLIIQWHNGVLIIENKPYAGDQDNQLERYYNHYKSNGIKETEVYLMYITRNSHKPSSHSLGKLNIDLIHCIGFNTIFDIFKDFSKTLSNTHHFRTSLLQMVHYLSEAFNYPIPDKLETDEKLLTLFKIPEFYNAAIRLIGKTDIFHNNQFKVFTQNICSEFTKLTGSNITCDIPSVCWRAWSPTIFSVEDFDFDMIITFDNKENMFLALSTIDDYTTWPDCEQKIVNLEKIMENNGFKQIPLKRKRWHYLDTKELTQTIIPVHIFSDNFFTKIHETEYSLVIANFFEDWYNRMRKLKINKIGYYE